MQHHILAALVAVACLGAGSTSAFAQTKPIQSPTPQPARDPAHRLPDAPAPAQPWHQGTPATPAVPQAAAPAPQPATTPAPAMTPAPTQPMARQAQAPTPAPTPAPAAVDTAPSADAGRARDWLPHRSRGGFFVGVQAGKGWIYDDVDQNARMLNAGYRWQAGAVSLLGLELAAGRLGSTTEQYGQYGRVHYGAVDYASIGFNGRFNFGRANPLYALVRAGYWQADTRVDDGRRFEHDVDGGYVGVGLGVDFNRHVNMSLSYTTHVYFNDWYWDNSSLYYDASRADTLMLGVEARF